MTISLRNNRGGFLCTLLAVVVVLILLSAATPRSFAQIATMSPLSLSNSTGSDTDRSIYVEGYITGGLDNGHSSIAPVPGAVIYFIKDQKIVNQTTSNAVGYYNVVITPGVYSVVTAAHGMQTLMTEETFKGTRTLDRMLKAVPYNGLVPYAVNPVVETSPGRPVSVTIAVENSQLGDQYLSFTEQTPNGDWVAWSPDGDMLGIRSGDKREINFMFQYNGDLRGTAVMYVLVSGGPFYAKIPIVIVVKDMPYESLDLYSNQPQRTIKSGTIAHFTFNVNNKYARDKPLTLDIQKPDGWGATTGAGTLFYAADEQQASSDFWVYAPRNAAPGFYMVNLTLKGQDVSSNTLHLQIQVEGTPAYDALIRGYKVSSEGYPSINLSEGDTFDLPVRIYNNGEFPLELMASAEVGDNWAYYLNGAPWDKLKVEPNGAGEFIVRSRVPNGTLGNYTAKIYLEGKDQAGIDQEYMLMAELKVLPRAEPALNSNTLGGLLLAAGTVGVIMVSLVLTAKKRRRY